MRGHISKRSKTSWSIKIDLPRGEDGKRRMKWITVKGSKAEADRRLTQLLHGADNGMAVVHASSTTGEFLRAWLDHMVHRVRPKTLERYKEIVEKHLIPALGHHRLDKLTPAAIQAYHATAMTSGRRKGKGGLSPTTAHHHHRVLHGALRQALRLRLLATNPASKEYVDAPRMVKRQVAPLDHDGAAKLIEAARGDRLYMPIVLALTTGMRRGEILALRWRDVQLDEASLSVVASLELTKQGLAFQPPKTARSRRTITLPSIAVDALRAHRAAQAAERLRLGPAWDDHDLVCPNIDGRPLSPKILTDAFVHVAKRAGVACRFHDLRHTHLSHLLAAGVHPKVASERAGHSSIAITLDTYSHVMPGLQEEAAKKVDTALRAALDKRR